jgi:carboxypeptidase C (cathepsin A)
MRATHAGVGYSVAGREADIPADMAGMAADLYAGLWGFFDAHPELQQRPFFIAGESYAGVCACARACACAWGAQAWVGAAEVVLRARQT